MLQVLDGAQGPLALLKQALELDLLRHERALGVDELVVERLDVPVAVAIGRLEVLVGPLHAADVLRHKLQARCLVGGVEGKHQVVVGVAVDERPAVAPQGGRRKAHEGLVVLGGLLDAQVLQAAAELVGVFEQRLQRVAGGQAAPQPVAQDARDAP